MLKIVVILIIYDCKLKSNVVCELLYVTDEYVFSLV